MPVAVREETADDYGDIRSIVAAAFARRAEVDLIDQLRKDGDSILSVVASEDGRLVGHILFSRMAAPFRALALAPVSVLPDRQRHGIGSLLIQAGLVRAAHLGWEAAVVLGEPEFYRRFGFDPELATGFTSPYAGPYLMVKALSGALPATTGSIEHAPAFSRVEHG